MVRSWPVAGVLWAAGLAVSGLANAAPDGGALRRLSGAAAVLLLTGSAVALSVILLGRHR